jgi:hypothetical protein
MKNFFKGLGYFLPTALFIIGAVYFCINEPLILFVTRIVLVSFYAIIISIFLLFGVAVVVWSLKNTLLNIFKINLNFKSKK